MIAIRCARVVVGIALAACTLTGCGYALAGRSNSLPGYIKSIGVPEFINQSTTPDIDRVLTEAVRQEFQSKGRYQVQPEAAGVDAVLNGTVTSVVLMPVQFTADRQVSSYSIIVTANVEFKDLTTGKVLWSNPGFRVTDEYQVTTGTTPNDPNALFTQDADALTRLSRVFARQTVTSVFEAF